LSINPKNAIEIMQTLFKNLFNLIKLLKISLFVFLNEIFQKPSVRGILRYQKINFFTTSTLFGLNKITGIPVFPF
jgi:hypothetical protein